MKIFVCGQKSFGDETLRAMINAGHEITGIAPSPQKRLADKMVGTAILHGIPVVSDCEKLLARYIPDDTELIIAAHSHWIISEACCAKCKHGGIGFHPSLLPRHRGQDAIRWTIHMRDAVTGGTVFRLNDKCDGGDIILQKMVFVDPAWNYHDLWRELFPLGISMLLDAVALIEAGRAPSVPQDERFATWEPSWERPRLRRNDLAGLPMPAYHGSAVYGG